MQRKITEVATALSFMFMYSIPIPEASADDVHAELRVDEDGIRGFCLAISEHFGVDATVVVRFHDKKIPVEHLPVVFVIAKEARVEPSAVVRLRLSGRSWMEVSAAFGLTAKVFHVAVSGNFGPPYGRAIGYYKKQRRSEWASIRLLDDEVVALANVKFLSAHHGCSPEHVLRAHREGDGVLRLHGRLKQNARSANRKTREANLGIRKRTTGHVEGSKSRRAKAKRAPGMPKRGRRNKARR